MNVTAIDDYLDELASTQRDLSPAGRSALLDAANTLRFLHRQAGLRSGLPTAQSAWYEGFQAAMEEANEAPALAGPVRNLLDAWDRLQIWENATGWTTEHLPRYFWTAVERLRAATAAPEPACDDDPDGQHHVGCGCD